MTFTGRKLDARYEAIGGSHAIRLHCGLHREICGFRTAREIEVCRGETDRDVRLEELYRRRAELDEEIAALNEGRVELMDATAIRDRYQFAK